MTHYTKGKKEMKTNDVRKKRQRFSNFIKKMNRNVFWDSETGTNCVRKLFWEY